MNASTETAAVISLICSPQTRVAAVIPSLLDAMMQHLIDRLTAFQKEPQPALCNHATMLRDDNDIPCPESQQLISNHRCLCRNLIQLLHQERAADTTLDQDANNQFHSCSDRSTAPHIVSFCAPACPYVQ